jgi:two-component system chemotaxis response regulator CheB
MSARRAFVVGIVASTGGPGAVAALLGGLPADFPGAIGLVQHLAPGFAQSFVRFLADTTPLRVRVAGDPDDGAPGTVIVAPDGRHLVAAPGGGFALHDAPAEDGHRPSGNVLLRSLAAIHGPAAIGVVLSGIGRDGADGLLAIRDAGGITFAQNEASAPVRGMARAAAPLCAADRILPPEGIARALAAIAAERRRSP